MTELFVVILLLLGSILCLIAAVGLVKLPDVFTRTHASTKAGTLGIEFVMIACAIHVNEPIAWFKAAIVVAFILLTAPVAAHMLGRTAYRLGEEIAEHTVCDDWHDKMRKESVQDQGKLKDVSAQPPKDLP